MPNFKTLAATAATVATVTIMLPEEVQLCTSTLWKGLKTLSMDTVKPYLTSAFAHVEAAQGAVATTLEKSAPQVFKLATRTITTINGTSISAGAGACVVGLAVCPVLGAAYKVCKRTISGMAQVWTNEKIMRTARALPADDLKGKIEVLETRAKSLEDRALEQREIASSGIGAWGLVKYAGTFLAPIALAPQISAVAAALCPAPALAVVTVGVGLCAIRFVAARFDSWRECAQADKTLKQAEIFYDEIEKLEDKMALLAQKDKQIEVLKASLDNTVQSYEILTEQYNDRVKGNLEKEKMYLWEMEESHEQLDEYADHINELQIKCMNYEEEKKNFAANKREALQELTAQRDAAAELAVQQFQKEMDEKNDQMKRATDEHQKSLDALKNAKDAEIKQEQEKHKQLAAEHKQLQEKMAEMAAQIQVLTKNAHLQHQPVTVKRRAKTADDIALHHLAQAKGAEEAKDELHAFANKPRVMVKERYWCSPLRLYSRTYNVTV